MINYNHKSFRPIQNTDNGETSSETIFYYKQEGNIISSEYKGGKIIHGHLIGLVNEEGCIEMCYHQININKEIMTGKCFSKPEILINGKIRLHETWQWTSGDFSSGTFLNDLKTLVKTHWKTIFIIVLVVYLFTSYTDIKAGIMDAWSGK